MKIIIPVNDNNIKSGISKTFGRAPYFYIYDAVSNNYQFIKNDARKEQSGAGIKAGQTIIDHKGAVLITPQCGENAGAVLKAGEVKIYKIKSNDITENLQAYFKGELTEINNFHSTNYKK